MTHQIQWYSVIILGKFPRCRLWIKYPAIVFYWFRSLSTTPKQRLTYVGTSRFFIPFSQLTKRLPIDSANESRVPLVALSFDQIIIVPGNPELSNVLEFIVSLKMVKTLVSRSRHTVPNFLEIEGVFISLLPSFNLMGEMAYYIVWKSKHMDALPSHWLL